jgi:hypothetical protein
MLTSKLLACAVAKGSPNAKRRYSRMMFAGRAAATKANILFDTGASCNFVSKKFTKQTGITVRPVEYFVRLAMTSPTLFHPWWPLSRLCLRMCQPLLSNLISRPDPLAVRCRGYPICCLSSLKCFRILCRLVCPLNVQKGTVFVQSQDIHRRLGRYIAYLRWNIKSWRSRSPSF